MKLRCRLLDSLNLFSFAHVVAEPPTIRGGVRHDYFYWANQYQNLGEVLARQARCFVGYRDTELTHGDGLKWHQHASSDAPLASG